MSFLHNKTRKIQTYGKRRTQVLAVHESLDVEEAPPSLTSSSATGSRGKENQSPRIEVYKDIRVSRVEASHSGLQFRVSSPARRPVLVSRQSSNNEVQQALVPEHKKSRRRVIAADVDEVDYEGSPKPRTGTSRRLIVESSESSVGTDAPSIASSSPSKRFRSAKPPAAVVIDLTANEESDGVPETDEGEEVLSEATSEEAEEEEQESQRTLRPRTRSFSAGPLPFGSSAKSLLEACRQHKPIPFGDIIHDIGKRLNLIGADRVRPRWTKMAEASYSEVFAISTSPQKVPKMEDVAVVKVIPLRGEPLRRQGQLVDLPQETEVADAERELRITRLLEGEGFVGIKGAFIVQGAYPTKLLSTWDAFKATRESENVRPDAFPSSQQYLLLCLPHCGAELETFKLSNWVEALSTLWQVALHLAKAERSHQFEHRDLHWGNILIQRVAPSSAVLALAKSAGHPPSQALAALSLASPADWPTRLSPARSGLRATIIDYTLSRATTLEGEVLCDEFVDGDIFEGQGDDQFEVYRQMRTISRGKWSTSTPTTNVLWLHYLVNKLLNEKGLRSPAHSKVLAATGPLRGPASARDQARLRAAAHMASSEKEAHAILLSAKKALAEQVDLILRKSGKANWTGSGSFISWFTKTANKAE